MNETVKRAGLWVVSVCGWIWAVGAATWATLEFDPSEGHFAPQWMSLSVFLSMGFAIAAGVSLGRINSIRALTKIFEAGALSAEVRQQAQKMEAIDREKIAERVKRNSEILEDLKSKVGNE